MMAQLAIGALGMTAIWLTQSRSSARRRYACLFGLCAQPFWFYTTYQAQQWGIFILCGLYTVSWGRGVWIHWLRRTA